MWFGSCVIGVVGAEQFSSRLTLKLSLQSRASAPRSVTLRSRFLTSPPALTVRSDEVTTAVKANKQKSSPFLPFSPVSDADSCKALRSVHCT